MTNAGGRRPGYKGTTYPALQLAHPSLSPIISLTLKGPFEIEAAQVRKDLGLWISPLKDVLQEVLSDGIETFMVFSNLTWYHYKLGHWLTLSVPVFT